MLTLLVTALVAVSGLGSEGTHPIVLFLYRSLVFAILFWCGRDAYRNDTFRVSPPFLAAGAVALLLALSFLRNPSTFEGFYTWYQFVLFAALFIVLSGYASSQDP